MKNKPRFVFDTNVFVSVALLPVSASKSAFQKAELIGTIVVSKETLTELADVLLRQKFDRYLTVDERLEFIDRVELRYDCIPVVNHFTDCRDDKDNKFLNLAFDAGASCIISGDKDLLILNPFHNIRILSPAEFLTIF